jgi:hypothetical protein
MMAVKRNDEGDVLVKAGLCKNPDTDESELYCHSVDKEKKKKASRTGSRAALNPT